MSVLEKIYNSLSDTLKGLNFNFAVLFPVLLGATAFLGVVCFLAFYLTDCYKLKAWSKKIVKHLSTVNSVEKEDEDAFTNAFFKTGCPDSLSNSWFLFLETRRGYVSKFVSEENVFEKEKKHSKLPLFLFGSIAIILICVISIFLTAAAKIEVLFLAVLSAVILATAIAIALFFFYRNLLSSTLTSFRELQDELDSKVLVQDICEFYPESEGLKTIADELDKMALRIEKYKIPDNYDELVDDEKKIDDDKKTVTTFSEQGKNEDINIVPNFDLKEGQSAKTLESLAEKIEDIIDSPAVFETDSASNFEDKEQQRVDFDESEQVDNKANELKNADFENTAEDKTAIDDYATSSFETFEETANVQQNGENAVSIDIAQSDPNYESENKKAVKLKGRHRN